MSDERQLPGDVDRIAGRYVTPTESAFEFARREMNDLADFANVDPNKQVIIILRQQVFQMTQRWDAAAAEAKEHRCRADDHNAAHLVLTGRNAAIEQRFNDFRGNVGVASLLAIFGGGMLSWAGADAGPQKPIVLAIGLTSFVIGMGLCGWAWWQSKPISVEIISPHLPLASPVPPTPPPAS